MTLCKSAIGPLLLAALLSLSAPAYGALRSTDCADLPKGAVKLSFEEFSLPNNEHMGMAGLGVSHNFTENLSLGVGSWMAVRGERGGFITLGISGDLHYPISETFGVESGLFVGAGGGRGGYTLSGGGLMLHTHAGLTCATGSVGRVALGVSAVDFPKGGTISSVQPYLSFTMPFTSLLESGWSQQSPDDTRRWRVAPNVHSLAVVVRGLRVSQGVLTDTGGAQGNFTLLGIEWRNYLDERWYAKLETEGAAGGSSTGYMQILAGGGLRLPLAEKLSASADLSVGGGGGGGVATGGGLLFDGSIGVQYFLTSNLFADVSGAWLTASKGSFEATSLAFKLGYQLGGKSSNHHDGAGSAPADVRIRVVNQTYLQASDLWRSHHADQRVDNLGVQIDYFLERDWYATGQGLAAYSGDAGAYMTGLIGAGCRKKIDNHIFLNGEALGGAAGGGGLAMGSGLVWQGNIGVGYEINPSLSALATAGRLQAVNGDFKANVIGLSLNYLFKYHPEQ